MGKIIILIGILLGVAVICALPLYITVNLVLWLFHIPFHLTILQALAIGLLDSVIRGLLFGKGKD